MHPLEHLKNKRFLLGSKSPRRKELLKGLAIDFTVVSIDVEENYSDSLKRNEITEFLSLKKANAFNELNDDDILITADTIVWYNNSALEKPKDRSEAIKMLQELSGNTHEVFTSVTIKSNQRILTVSDETKVTISPISNAIIEFYIDEFKPYDKAGSYGIQEWFGYANVEKIEGSYHNVMGLPTQKIFKALKELVF